MKTFEPITEEQPIAQCGTLPPALRAFRLKCCFLVLLCSFSFSSSTFFAKKKFKRSTASAPVAEKYRVRVALGSAPRSLDPRQGTDANSMRLTDLLFDPLVRLGPNLQVQPALADKWTYKNKVYTFFISPHWKFSNGRKISQKDLLFSFEEYKKGPFASALEIVQSIQVRKEKNVVEYYRQGKTDSPIKAKKEEEGFLVLEIKLKRESAKFLRADLPIFKILPHDLASQPDFHKKPVGTGPFKLKSQNAHQLVFSKSYLEDPSLSGPKLPKKLIKSGFFLYSIPIIPFYEPQTTRERMMSIKEVVFKIVRDDFTLFQKMLNEELDVAQSEISFQKSSYFLNKKDRFQVFQGPGLSTTYLLLNFRDECLKKLKVRQLLARSIDRLKIIQYKLNGFARPAVTLLNPDNEFFNSRLQNPVYSLPKAKAIWKQLPKNCRQKTFSLKMSHARSAVDHGKALTLQLKKAGLKIKQESYEWGRFYSDLNAGQFQIALLKWVGVIDPDIYRVAFHSKEQAPKGRNRGFYKNPRVDRLLEKGIVTMNLTQRKAIYHKIQEIIQKDLAFVPLWHEKQVAILRKTILHYRLSRAGDFRYLLDINKSVAPNNF